MSVWIPRLSAILSALVLLVFFQNCAEDNLQFSSTSSSSTSLNDLGGGDTDNCVVGQRLGVWLDENDDGDIANEQYLGSFVAFEGDTSSSFNYDFYSASAHPIIGPQPFDNRFHVFFYSGSDGLTLNFYSNIDKAGSQHDKVHLDITTVGNNQADDVILSDDGGELQLLVSDTANQSNYYEGRFEYWTNTDGGIIGPFVTQNFGVKVSVVQLGVQDSSSGEYVSDIQAAEFYSSNGQSFSLSTPNTAISSFIVGYKGYETCR